MAAAKSSSPRRKRNPAARSSASRYLYVECRGWMESGQRVQLDGPVSFDHIIVRAKSETEAYQLGTAKLQTRQDAQDPELHPHITGSLLNDYVVKL